MDETKRKLSHSSVLAVPVPVADRLLQAGNPNGVLLYLYILRHGGELNEAAALRDLPLTQAALSAAVETLARLGILSGGEKAPLPAQELPEYQARDVVRRTAEDPAFIDLLRESQSVLGRVLSTADAKKLFGIYDDLALPVDVIMLLIHYCKERHQERYGAEKNLGFATIEKEAYAWFNREIRTAEMAEQWLAELEDRRSRMGVVQRRLGIQGRSLSPSEEKYITQWLELGFGPEAIAEAADRTIRNTGELRWRYMNSIVQSWHKKGLYTMEQIEQGDKKPSSVRRSPAGKPASVDTPEPTAADNRAMEQLERLLKKMENS